VLPLTVESRWFPLARLYEVLIEKTLCKCWNELQLKNTFGQGLAFISTDKRRAAGRCSKVEEVLENDGPRRLLDHCNRPSGCGLGEWKVKR
jgi:hypothetical protein